MTERSDPIGRQPVATSFTSAELTAIAHLYRGEVYRSTIWRTRLDQTTNWAVVTTGLAMSLTFSGPYASPLPLILVGMLVVVFLMLESRRYRYFNVWRARCRLMETDIYGPLLRGEGVRLDGRVEHAARPRLRAAVVPHQLPPGDRAAAQAELSLHPGDPGDRLLRQAGDPPDAGRDVRGLPAARLGRAAAGLGRGARGGGVPRHLDRAGAGDPPDRAQVPGGGAADLDGVGRAARTPAKNVNRVFTLPLCAARASDRDGFGNRRWGSVPARSGE